MVMGEGRKKRTLFFSRKTRAAMFRYLKDAGSHTHQRACQFQGDDYPIGQ